MTPFLVIGLVGLLVLLVSLVAGDVLDGALDALAGDVFSSAVIGGFVAAAGFGAAAAQGAGLPLALDLGIGAGAGVAMGFLAWWLTRLVRDGSSDATVTTDDTLGREGRVISSIPAEGYGTVRVLVGGHVLQLNARSAQPLDPGTEVHVTEVLSPTAITVAPLWGELPPGP